MEQGKSRVGGIARRRFLYSLGAAAAGGIGGWIALREGRRGDATPTERPAPVAATGHCPRLAPGIEARATVDGGDLIDDGVVVAHLNRSGWRVVGRLDGRHDIAELADAVDRAPGTDATAAVASFLAELGTGGLLAEPFFVNIHAMEVKA